MDCRTQSPLMPHSMPWMSCRRRPSIVSSTPLGRVGSARRSVSRGGPPPRPGTLPWQKFDSFGYVQYSVPITAQMVGTKRYYQF